MELVYDRLFQGELGWTHRLWIIEVWRTLLRILLGGIFRTHPIGPALNGLPPLGFFVPGSA
tara:strand:+ start:328 stop:510 length:183 start_codon:yes stop_codon:yes gene_type:complete